MPRPRHHQSPVEALVGVAPLASRWIERLLAGHEPPLTLGQFSALRAIAAEPLSAADQAINRITAWKPAVDLTVQQVGQVAQRHMGWADEVFPATALEMKQQLALGRPLIVGVRTHGLGNPQGFRDPVRYRSDNFSRSGAGEVTRVMAIVARPA